MSTNLGASVLKKLTTARLYWQLSGQAGYVDFGNVTEYKDDPKIERVSHMQGQKGFHRLDFELLKQVATKKTFTLDEHFAATIALMLLSNQYPGFSQFTSVTQEGITSDSTTVTADNSQLTADGGEDSQIIAELTPLIAGATYDLARQAVTIVAAVDGHDNPLVANTDYSLDSASGMLTVLDAHPVAPWKITFTCLTLTDLVFDAFSNLLSLGNFYLVEFDQFSQVPRNTETFSGQVYVTGWGENKSENFNEYTIEVLHQNSVRTMRAD